MTSSDNAVPDAEPQSSELRAHNPGGRGPRRRVSESAFNGTALLLYVGILVVVAFHHERWRDEADTWLFVRDAGYTTIVTMGGYTGQMAPWYLMVAPLAKSGAPYASIAFLNGLFAVAAVALVLWRAPFGRTVRVLFAFSHYPLYEYGVIARPYALTMFVLFVVASMVPFRRRWPGPYAAAVFVLSNMTVQGLFVGFALTLAQCVEVFRNRASWRREAFGIAVMGSGLLLAALQVRTPADAAIAGFLRMFKPSNVAFALADAFFPLIGSGSAWAAMVGGVLVVLVAIHVRRRFVPSMVLWVTLALFAYLWILKWPGSARHHGFVVLVVFFVVWIARSEGLTAKGPLHAAVDTLLAGTLICSMVVAMYKAALDVMYPFSGAKAAAAFIEGNGLAGYPIAGHSAPRAAAVLPYLPGRKKIWFAGIGEYGSWLTWDHEFNLSQMMGYPEAVARTRQHFGPRPYLLLLDSEMPDPDGKGFELLYASPDRIIGYPDERYYLYRETGQRNVPLRSRRFRSPAPVER